MGSVSNGTKVAAALALLLALPAVARAQATGTISGSDPGSYGSLIELTQGKGPFLADGDTVVLRGRAGDLALGEVTGTILPSP